MSSHSGKIQEIRKLLVSAEDFSYVFGSFFDFIEGSPDFIEKGKKYKNSILKSLLEAIGAGVFKCKCKCTVTHVRLLMIAEENFVHGSCLIDGHMAAILYCPDIEMGMVAVTQAPFSSQMHYVRITATVIKDRDAASVGHPLNRTLQ
ncbi:MAG: hypothetical protein FD153_1944 [Rhodospirillaceae bacterium]|nr:MAG: hypothetical protein FD153_1944 [Rhodospirillaceae bacterium]